LPNFLKPGNSVDPRFYIESPNYKYAIETFMEILHNLSVSAHGTLVSLECKLKADSDPTQMTSLIVKRYIPYNEPV